MHFINYSCFIALVTLSFSSCSRNEHSEISESQDKHDHEGEIIISHEDAERFGVKTDTIILQPFNSIIRVTGQLSGNATDEATVSAPTAGIINLSNIVSVGARINSGSSIGFISAKNLSGGDPNESARVAVASAKRELDRLEPLMKEGIVTKKEYNSALAAYQSAKAAYSPNALSGSVTTPISGVVSEIYVKSGDFVNIGAPIARISKNTSLLLQAEMPEKYRSSVPYIVSANIRLPYSDTWINIDSLGGKLLSLSGSNAITRAGYIPVMFSLTNNGTMSSGAFVDICLITSDNTECISVPTKAIVEQQGNYFVFVKTSDHGFEKRRITTGHSDGIRTKVLSGVNSGDVVVTEGATIIRLAENQGNIPQHSHNH